MYSICPHEFQCPFPQSFSIQEVQLLLKRESGGMPDTRPFLNQNIFFVAHAFFISFDSLTISRPKMLPLPELGKISPSRVRMVVDFPAFLTSFFPRGYTFPRCLEGMNGESSKHSLPPAESTPLIVSAALFPGGG